MRRGPHGEGTPADTPMPPPDPGWASINRGVLICDECCSVHRSLGRHISIVKHLRHSPWPATLLQVGAGDTGMRGHPHWDSPVPTGPCLSPADGAHLGKQRGQLHLGALAAGPGAGAERAPQGEPPGQSAVSAPCALGRGSALPWSPLLTPKPAAHPQPHQVGVHPCQVPDAGLRPQAAVPR